MLSFDEVSFLIFVLVVAGFPCSDARSWVLGGDGLFIWRRSRSGLMSSFIRYSVLASLVSLRFSGASSPVLMIN